jgi:hypothetical protein
MLRGFSRVGGLIGESAENPLDRADTHITKEHLTGVLRKFCHLSFNWGNGFRGLTADQPA